MGYSASVSQLSLVHQYGLNGVYVDNNDLKPSSLIMRIFSIIKMIFSSANSSDEVRSLVQRKIEQINGFHSSFDFESQKDFTTYFHSAKLFHDWNKSVLNLDPKLQVNYTGKLPVHTLNFPNTLFNCYYLTPELKPLIVSPQATDMDLIVWANSNQSAIAHEMKHHGVIIFRGFSLNEESFPTTLSAICGKPLREYPGAVPREAVGDKVYKSTAVKDAHKIPLHQEVADHPAKMPDYISFFCVTSPTSGGQTLLGDVRAVTNDIQETAHDIWDLLLNHQLTYTSRYLPDHSWRTAWMQRLNSAHANAYRRFATEDRGQIDQLCRDDGTTCIWDRGWAIVTRENAPGVINVDGETLFCNNIHTVKFSPTLCGGMLNYLLARLFLYQSLQSTQANVRCSNGTPIEPKVGERILTILKKHEIVLDWQANDLMVVDNKTMMHGKTPHKGPRKIIVAMA